jgi:hypothetical protein
VSPLLEPDWKQEKPARAEVENLTSALRLRVSAPETPNVLAVLAQLRTDRGNGGAHLVRIDVAPNRVFNWYASRNRLYEHGVLTKLLTHPDVVDAVRDVNLDRATCEPVFTLLATFDFDCIVANALFTGGAYSTHRGDGRAQRYLALALCEELFGARFGEISAYVSHEAWTPWFLSVAWDMTLVAFDRRTSTLWLLVATDED